MYFFFCMHRSVFLFHQQRISQTHNPHLNATNCHFWLHGWPDTTPGCDSHSHPTSGRAVTAPPPPGSGRGGSILGLDPSRGGAGGAPRSSLFPPRAAAGVGGDPTRGRGPHPWEGKERREGRRRRGGEKEERRRKGGERKEGRERRGGDPTRIPLAAHSAAQGPGRGAPGAP